MAQSYYPMDEEGVSDRVRTSVRLPVEQQQDIELMAHLWNELDRALGRKKPRKWKAASVIERLIAVGIDGFWAQVGGRPATAEERKALIERVVEQATSRKKK